MGRKGLEWQFRMKIIPSPSRKKLWKIIKILLKNKVKFTINTDGSEMYDTSIYKEQELLVKNGILSRQDIHRSTKLALEASFIK